jgi:LysM repeat protein
MILGVVLTLAGTGCASPDAPDPSPPTATTTSPDSSAQQANANLDAAPPAPQGERSLNERLNDLSLAARIKQALARDQRLRGYDFEPEVEGGTVLLQGDVQTESEYERAARIAAQLPAVEAVTNAVTVFGQPVVTNETGTNAHTASGATHVVQPGETLWDIARSHRSSVDRIQQHNGLRDGRLQPGQTLKIPSP